MAEAGWVPTVDTYLGRVPKARILAAVREAKGETAAERLAHLKKAEMGQEAESLLAGTGWLPEALRAPRCEEAATTDASTGEPLDPWPDHGADTVDAMPERIAAE